MKNHVGVYIGNGEVIEAKGHAYGVVKTKLKDRPWKLFGRLNWLNYIQEDKEMLDGATVKMIKGWVDTYGENVVDTAIRRLINTYVDDGQPAPWAEKEVEEAKALGLTDGKNPEMFTTRQEVMIMCKRAYEKALNNKKEEE